MQIQVAGVPPFAVPRFPTAEKNPLEIQLLLNSSESGLHQLTALLDCRGQHKPEQPFKNRIGSQRSFPKPTHVFPSPCVIFKLLLACTVRSSITWRHLVCLQLTSPSFLNTPSLAPLPQRLQARSASLLSWPQIKCPLPSDSPTRKLVICPVPSPAHRRYFQQMRRERTKKRPVVLGSRTWALRGYTLCLGWGRGAQAGREGLPETSWDPRQCRSPPAAACPSSSSRTTWAPLAGICYDGLEGLLYLGLFSLLAALAFSVMICLGLGAWKHCVTRDRDYEDIDDPFNPQARRITAHNPPRGQLRSFCSYSSGLGSLHLAPTISNAPVSENQAALFGGNLR
ncbi:uncharacterized protein LOC129555892 isoform X2 [Moschus berezovskii]|uniref:uncharacterized protein LOC129555892 isoform X2 n=1 Tax=Moschus berezovskii TaxID=68408 RepID=UPI0024447C42|nr:uncharacterized protein LOC129555892 isoform X2 [Moschus berezovskii]